MILQKTKYLALAVRLPILVSCISHMDSKGSGQPNAEMLILRDIEEF